MQWIKVTNSSGTVYYYNVALLGRIAGTVGSPTSLAIVIGGLQLSGMKIDDWNAGRLLDASFNDVGPNPLQIA